nr:MAG TPA: hypothetical protein [Caudoviricetes sp.]
MNICSVNNKDNVIEKTGYFRIKSILLGGARKDIYRYTYRYFLAPLFC